MQTYAITNKQAQNLRMAYAIMAGIPADRIYLSEVRAGDRNDEGMKKCGSAGCVGGWLSAHPYFIERGLFYRYGVELRGSRSYCLSDIAASLFGPVGRTVFNAGPSGIDGKQLALSRIRNALLDAGRISSARNDELIGEEVRME